MSVSRKDISVKEAFQQLLDLRYPDYIVLGEISKLKEKGLVLPYQGLFDAYYEKFTHSGMEVVVDNYLKKAAKEQYSAKQIVIKLRTFGYPDEFMARFLDQHIDLDLPFEEIYPLLGRKKNKAVIVPVEEIQPSVREVAHISPDGEGFTQQPSLKDLLMVEGKKHDAIVEAEERAEEEEKEVKLPPRKPHKTGKVHKIVNREEAITTLDKKALVSLCIAAAGSISTAVLVCLFKVNPAVAAKNCVDSINAFVSGSTGLQQILPPAKELVSILGTVGTTIAGTIAYLRSNSKRKKLMQEDEREQTKEMDAVLSEQQQKIGEFVSEVLAEQEEEKGGKRL